MDDGYASMDEEALTSKKKSVPFRIKINVSIHSSNIHS